MSTQSKELTDFYQDIYQWILNEQDKKNAGWWQRFKWWVGLETLPETTKYEKSVGLCGNLAYYAEKKWRLDHSMHAKIYIEMINQFRDNNLNAYYPFNQPSIKDFEREFEEQGTMYNNQKRLVWIKSHAWFSN